MIILQFQFQLGVSLDIWGAKVKVPYSRGPRQKTTQVKEPNQTWLKEGLTWLYCLLFYLQIWAILNFDRCCTKILTSTYLLKRAYILFCYQGNLIEALFDNYIYSEKLMRYYQTILKKPLVLILFLIFFIEYKKKTHML